MLYKRTIVNTKEQRDELINKLETSVGWLSFDTETTGLHLKKDKPFLITLSFNEESYAIPLILPLGTEVQKIFDAMGNFEFVIGHNVKYDLHMLQNIGVSYKYDNLTDTMTMARLALATDEVMSLSLKSLAKIYLHASAGDDEKMIKSALTALRRQRTNDMKDILKEHGKTKKWYDDVTKDSIFASHDLGPVEKEWIKYNLEHPEPTYLDIFLNTVYQDAMYSYAMNDTEITLELAKKLYPALKGKNQEKIFKLENSLIKPFLRMERVGLKIDRDYLFKARARMRSYIIERRKDLEKLAGEYVKVGQHKRIKEIFEEKFDIKLPSTDDRALKGVEEGAAGELAEVIRELRTLEKWYSAYIERMLDKSEFDGRAYTQINSASAITGRVSSDFQQFPKYGIHAKTGEELVNPRKMVVVSGGDHNAIYYFDYSQIELRVQANYTYDISGGDLNMCRAYMPFKCHTKKGHSFNPEVDHDIITSEVWYYDEDETQWEPVDLHAATTMEAFPDVDRKSPEFKRLRNLGKSTNFAKNYGATTKALMEQFGFDKETAEKLNNGYYRAFPKILDYQKAVTQSFYRRGFVKNRYGRRYYLDNKRFVYKLYNYIIQGTCADMLKEKIVEIDKLLLPYKTRFQMNIHDELSFELYKGEEFLLPLIKQIMEDVDWMIIPTVSDLEVTKTNWAEKKEVNVL